MGAAVLGAIRRCWQPARRQTAWLVVVLVTAGFAGRVVATGPAGDGREESSAAASSRAREPASVVHDLAAPTPEPAADPVPTPAPAAPTAPAAPPAEPLTPEAPPPPAASPPPAPAPRVRTTSPPSPPATGPWTASSGPLDASAPLRVEIPTLGITAPVGPLGLNPDGTLEVPRVFSRAGWYTGRPTPGQTGPAIVVAHRAGRRGPGAFWKLPDVQPGQEVVVTRADGRRVRFVVDRLEQHRKDAFPTEAVYGPTPETALRLITCGGPFEPSLGDRYRDNIIVFARMTGWAS